MAQDLSKNIRILAMNRCPEGVCFLQVNIIGRELGLGFAGIGYEPKWPLSERPSVPKVGWT